MKDNPDSHDKLLDSFCKDLCFVIPPGSDSGPTFRHGDGRSSRIDFILAQQPNLLSSVKHEDDVFASMNTSDHTALMTCINSKKPISEKSTPKTSQNSIKNWEKVNIKDNKKNCFSLLSMLVFNNNNSTDEVLQMFQSALMSAADSCIPAKKPKINSKKLQQLNPDLVRKMKYNNNIFKALKEAKDDAHIRSLTEDCKKAKRALRSQQRQDTAKKRNNTFRNIMNAHTGDQKLFFKLINE